MKICLKCNQNCTDAEEVCQRCGGTQFRYLGGQGGQRPPMAGQNLGVNRQRPPMNSQLNKNNQGNMNNMGATGAMGGQRPMGQNPNRVGQNPSQSQMGQRPPMSSQFNQNQGHGQMGQAGQVGQRPNGQNPNSMGQSQMGQRPRQNMNPNNQFSGQRPPVNGGMNNGMNNGMNENPFTDNGQNVGNMGNNRSIPMTQLQENDLPPKPDVQNLPPKEAKRVLKEWEKKVNMQAKENKKLAKQQQDAVKKVEALKKKGKPVPPELEQLAAGAAIEAAHKNSRNNVTNVRGQVNNNVNSQENQGETSGFEYTEETVMMTEWIKHLLICLIPIYNIIYLVKIVNGSSDSKPQLKEFAKLQLILIIAAVVIGIASGLIMNIVMSSMW